MTKVQLLVSATMPDPRAQCEPTALYRLYGADGTTLLYIGISTDPDRRFKQHRDSKPWWPLVGQKTIEWHPSRDHALAEEATAIKAEAPAYNIDHNPAAQQAVDPRVPPADMPADLVAGLRQAANTLPADIGESVLRAGFEGFARDRLIAALPDAVDQSMRTALPHRYTPELAARFTQNMVAELRARYSELTVVTA
ncbi:hypothetical protein GCM10023084_05200 [Streptomyces lacrimifluminis]|uniref:GIY-YIG domain-containing protein n=1 Tax=Streptomyces lacrimifluminis TaxID=1500077 RepID=A0A917KQ12_9ACTN|nr:hypothetical protein [Streptomyces lacrimifluminis]GGJ22686.1 hypothetical protein GCM10012282_18940 [Streptomyces lacrimifluminis]